MIYLVSLGLYVPSMFYIYRPYNYQLSGNLGKIVLLRNYVQPLDINLINTISWECITATYE